MSESWQPRQESPDAVGSCYSEDGNCLYDSAHEARRAFGKRGWWASGILGAPSGAPVRPFGIASLAGIERVGAV